LFIASALPLFAEAIKPPTARDREPDQVEFLHDHPADSAPFIRVAIPALKIVPRSFLFKKPPSTPLQLRSLSTARIT
jgi:hypothetical protein